MARGLPSSVLRARSRLARTGDTAEARREALHLAARAERLGMPVIGADLRTVADLLAACSAGFGVQALAQVVALHWPHRREFHVEPAR